MLLKETASEKELLKQQSELQLRERISAVGA